MGALALARRHLRGQGARAALTAAGVACGVALVVAIRVINASTLASFTDAIEDLAGTAALQVRGPGPFPETVAEQLRAIPGVDHAVPIVTTTFFGAEPPIAGEALSVFAADVTDGHAIRTLHLVKAGEHVVDDPLGFLVDPRSVIVTDALAARLGVTTRATLPLRTPHGIETFTVRGVLPPGGAGRAFGGNLILMDVVGAQLVLGEDGLIDQVDVTLAPGVRVEDVERRLRAALPAGLEVIRPARRGEQIERYLASFQTLLSGLSGLALLGAIFVAGSAVATSVAARRRELGILRCAGAERRQVAALVLSEAFATGIVGAAAGVPLGIVLARLLLRTVTESTELIFSMTVFPARLVRIPDQLALAAAVLALGLGLMMTAATVARSFEESVLDFIRRQVHADLVVASTAATGWIEAPLDEAVGDRLAAVAGVARVERVRLAEHDYRGARISIDSLDASAFAPEREGDFSFAAGDAPAALAAVRAGTGVLVSRHFARQFDVGVGAALPLDTPAGPFEAPVAGVVVDHVSPRGSVILARPTYLRWWQDRSANRFHVTLAAGPSLDAVRHALATRVDVAHGLQVLTQRELYTYHRDAVRRAFRLTDALEILPLVVAALGLAEALLAVSLDRRHEFALLRAAGATRAQVARAVMGESAGVGALGLAGGLAIGLVLALIWVRVNFTYQLGWEIDFHFAAGSIPAAAAAALLVSVPAGLLPARRVARLPVLEALRAE